MRYTDEELKRALEVANSYAQQWQPYSLGAEDYAATAIEKLLLQKKRPENIEAWLKLVIKNMMIDRHKKLKARKPSLRGLEPEELQTMISGRERSSISSQIADKDLVADLLDELPPKEQQLLVLETAGFTTAEIAEELGYASAKVVATRIKQVRKKLQDRINASSRS
jgi:RNA polymerase sigma factor (sigma-70 family)